MRMEGGAHAPKKKNSSKKPNMLGIVAAGIIVVALIVGGIMIFNFSKDKGDTVSSSDQPSSESTSSDTTSAGEVVSEVVLPEPDVFDSNGILAELSEFYEINPDFVGRVYIEGSMLDQNVVQTKNEKVLPDGTGKNLYYLTHNLYKEKDPYGTVFLDYQATIGTGFQSKFLTLYGHNSKDGGYFEGAKLYQDIEYYKANPIINFDTIYGKGQYKIIGYFTLYVEHDKGIPFGYHQYVDEGKERFDEYMTELDKINYFDSGVDVDFDKDYILTLSTCNDEIQGAKNTPYRDVLVARKVRPGESPTVDISKIKPNTDMVMPEGWVKKFGKQNPYK